MLRLFLSRNEQEFDFQIYTDVDPGCYLQRGSLTSKITISCFLFVRRGGGRNG